MDCRDCSLYDVERETCRSRKLNPQHKEDAVDVARMYGVRALCVFNEHREPIVQRMYDKEILSGLLSSAPRRTRRRE